MDRVVRNSVIPDWVPDDVRGLDLTELAQPDAVLREVCAEVERSLGVNIAAYRRDAVGHRPGLCTIFKAAGLDSAQLATIAAAERACPGVFLVAYSRPLVRLVE